MSATIGQKVKFFRTHRKISQFDLELAIGASNGSISRIENDQTNPTKETLDSISKELGLNFYERNYLYGFTSEPATKEEMEKARQEIDVMMRTRGVLAYLIDDRSRMIDISDTFLQILNIPLEELSNIRNISLIKLILDPKYNVIKYFDKNSSETILYNFFQSLYSRDYFFIDDAVVQDERDFLKNDLRTKDLWDKVIHEPFLGVQDIEKRIVPFYFGGKKVPLIFSNTPLVKYNRFQLVEYTVTDEIRELLGAII